MCEVKLINIDSPVFKQDIRADGRPVNSLGLGHTRRDPPKNGERPSEGPREGP